MRTKLSLTCLFAILVFVSIGSAARADENRYQHGIMIDTGEYDWCHYDCAPFDRPTLYFCVQVADQILIGSRKVDWVWMYDSSKMLRLKGQPISFRYDEHSMWIIRTDGKDMQLGQDYSRDEFSRPECVGEVHRHWLLQFQHVKRPDIVPPEAVLVPLGPRPLFKRLGPHFWVSCTFSANTNPDVCTTWNETGTKYRELECVNSVDRQPVFSDDLVIDPLTTQADYQIHLINGTVLDAVIPKSSSRKLPAISP
jgi:hypothetical protein